jgi:hypothetical protein
MIASASLQNVAADLGTGGMGLPKGAATGGLY